MWWILPVTSVLRECLQKECWKFDISLGYIVCSCQPELQRKARSQKPKENQTGLETYRRVCHPLLWPVVPTSVRVWTQDKLHHRICFGIDRLFFLFPLILPHSSLLSSFSLLERRMSVPLPAHSHLLVFHSTCPKSARTGIVPAYAL